MREKLIELLIKADKAACETIQNRDDNDVRTVWQLLADHLIANGVRLEEKQATSKTSEQFASDNNVGGKWISVKERLPEKDVLVLCVGAKGGLFLGCPRGVGSDETAWTYVPNARGSRYTKYWTYLPEPPKGE